MLCGMANTVHLVLLRYKAHPLYPPPPRALYMDSLRASTLSAWCTCVVCRLVSCVLHIGSYGPKHCCFADMVCTGAQFFH